MELQDFLFEAFRIGIISSIISIITTLLSQKNTKKALVAQSITVNRIEWISNVRNLVSKFLYAYIDQQSKNELIKIKTQIILYFSKNEDYKNLVLLLEDACMGTYCPEKVTQIVNETQVVLQRTWRRIKLEGGQSKKEDIRIKNVLDKYDTQHIFNLSLYFEKN